MGLGPGSYTRYVRLLKVHGYYPNVMQASTLGGGWSQSRSSSRACTKNIKMFNRPQSTSGRLVSPCGTILTLEVAFSSSKTTTRLSLYVTFSLVTPACLTISADGTRFCRDRRCRSQLDPFTRAILGD